MTMKRILIAIALACAAVSSFGATLNPVQLLNPAGSSSGQAIISTGASTAPAWGNVPVANVTGAAALTGAVFTGNVALSYPSAATQRAFIWLNNSSPRWFIQNDGAAESGSNAGSNLTVSSFSDSGSFIGNPFTITRSTGAVTLTNSGTAGSSLAINASGNTGSGAQIFLSGNGATTPNKYIRAFNGAFQIVNSANSATPMSMDDAGNMTLTGTLTATGIAGNTTGTAASAGTIGEVPSATFSSVSMTTTTVQNLTSINLTAGVYLVWGSATYTVGTGATMNIWLAGVSQTTGALPALGTYFQSNGSITATGAATANAPMYLLALSSAKTIYLTGEAVFSGGAVTATGFLAALRIH